MFAIILPLLTAAQITEDNCPQRSATARPYFTVTADTEVLFMSLFPIPRYLRLVHVSNGFFSLFFCEQCFAVAVLFCIFI